MKTIVFFIVLGLSFGGIAQAKVKKPAKLAMCAACHGKNGIGTTDLYPNLAGQKKKYLIKQLNDFKSKKRNDPSMAGMVAALTKKDIEALAAYYSSLKP